jgi:hypothetical protein
MGTTIEGTIAEGEMVWNQSMVAIFLGSLRSNKIRAEREILSIYASLIEKVNGCDTILNFEQRAKP